MPDLIIKKQDTGNISVSTTTQNVVIQATPTNSYVLPPATANTLGGVIIGSNLSITGNGVLSANIPPGGVTAFNNRTGNVTLTANDVASLSFPLSSNLTVTSGDKITPFSIYDFYANFPQYSRNIYGVTCNLTSANYTHNSYFGLQKDSLTGPTPEARPVIGKYKTDSNGTASQVELYFDAGVNFHSTTRTANNTLIEKVFFFTQAGGLTFGIWTATQFSNFEVHVNELTFDAELKDTANIGLYEILRRGDGDKLYQPLTRRN